VLNMTLTQQAFLVSLRMPPPKEDAPSKASYFTEEEVSILTKMYMENCVLLQGNFQGPGGSASKNRVWSEITAAVNAVGGNGRTTSQCQKKIKNIRGITKQIASKNNAEIGKTGGGAADITPLNPTQELMLQTFAKAQIQGIAGGLDVHDPSPLVNDLKMIGLESE
jgi:hypothetical protein